MAQRIAVLGGIGSPWRKPRQAIELLLGQAEPPADAPGRWAWMRNPLPPAAEGPDYTALRRALRMADADCCADGDSFERLSAPDRARAHRVFPRFREHANPFIRHIVRRTREYLETTPDPETGEPLLRPVRVRLHGEGDEDAIRLPPFLADAYALAEAFCGLLGERTNTGFFRTMLLRRVGSTMEAGRRTVERLLNDWQTLDDAEDDEETLAELKTLTGEERTLLERFLKALAANQEQDPKLHAVRRLLLDDGWLALGCILFSQYYDSPRWLAEQLSATLPAEPIGLYAGAGRSGLIRDGELQRLPRDTLKEQVRDGDIRLLIGTDAASEGLNLQRLGTLINLDLPWNPSRLEQRKGRIQRIGQRRDTVDICNLRYAGSVEDRVHALLSSRLEQIAGLFGQLPDVLEAVWIDVALGRIERARETIDAVPQQHPFALRWTAVQPIEWETCSRVLDADERRTRLRGGWAGKGKVKGA